MSIIWTTALPIGSTIIAFVSVVFAARSSMIARRSLELAYKTGQVAYESSKTAQTPVVGLFLTEFECRRPVARDLGGILGSDARYWASKGEPDCLEVVVRGRLVNELPHEALLTCRDHVDAGRDTWYAHRNQSVFIVGGREVELDGVVLDAQCEVAFEWIDRRPREDWIGIRNLHCGNMFDDPELELPTLTWREYLHAWLRGRSTHQVRRHKVKRSGFRLVCEPRNVQRVATVWRAEVVKVPVETLGRDDDQRIVFQDWLGIVPGPLDDHVVHYRSDFDSTLAMINPPKIRYLPGRF